MLANVPLPNLGGFVEIAREREAKKQREKQRESETRFRGFPSGAKRRTLKLNELYEH